MANIPETIPEVNDETADKPTTPRMGTTVELNVSTAPTADGLNETASTPLATAPTANGLNETASTPLAVGREDSLLALSLSLQKLNKKLAEDAEDEESESESDGSDSESDSDSTEALDRTEQPRSNAEQRPPHVRSVWAVPLRIRFIQPFILFFVPISIRWHIKKPALSWIQIIQNQGHEKAGNVRRGNV